MKRTQIYLDPEQHDFLEAMAFYLGRSQKRKVSMSEVIREAIEQMRRKNPKVMDETDLILRDANLMKELTVARNEEGFLDYEDVFGH